MNPSLSLLPLSPTSHVEQASEQLFESGGLVMLAEELQSGQEHKQLQAISALAQLSAQPQHASAIVDNGCVSPLLGLLEHRNQARNLQLELGSFFDPSSSPTLPP